MHDDGSGTVSVAVALDPTAVQAAEAGGGKLEDRVRLGDLGTAGWTVSPWARAKDGSATLTLTKPFSTPQEVAGILDEVSGTVGPLKRIHATRDHGLISTRYGLTGSVDLSKLQTGIAADPDLVKNLTGQQIDVSALDASLTQQLQDALKIRVVAKLPGGTTTVVGRSGKTTAVDAKSSVLDTRRIVLLAVAAILLAAVGVLLFGGWRRRRVRRP
jgi:hypothetical protein